MAGGLKGSDLIVEAMPGILQAHGSAKAVFVGDGDAKMHCDHRSKELGVEGSCRFLGAKRGQELVDLYKACDVVVVPSQVGCPVNEWENGLVMSCTPEGFAWGCSE